MISALPYIYFWGLYNINMSMISIIIPMAFSKISSLISTAIQEPISEPNTAGMER